MSRRRLPLLALVALTPLFAGLFGLRRWGAWYSGDFTYRLQTAALLRGSLALQGVPHGQRYDWAWGRGSQQVWGLGMPLLRLPFEAAAQLLGGFGFPDALTFVILYAGGGGVALLPFGRVPPGSRRRSWVPRCARRSSTVPYALRVLRGGGRRGSVRDRARRAALALRGAADGARLFAIAALAGLGALFRPTMIFYCVPALRAGAVVSGASCRGVRWPAPAFVRRRHRP